MLSASLVEGDLTVTPESYFTVPTRTRTTTLETSEPARAEPGRRESESRLPSGAVAEQLADQPVTASASHRAARHVMHRAARHVTMASTRGSARSSRACGDAGRNGTGSARGDGGTRGGRRGAASATVVGRMLSQETAGLLERAWRALHAASPVELCGRLRRAVRDARKGLSRTPSGSSACEASGGELRASASARCSRLHRHNGRLLQLPAHRSGQYDQRA